MATALKKITDQESYFKSRDLTLNEILADDHRILVTKQGLRDTLRRIIRPSEYTLQEKKERAKNSSSMISKMLRFYAESIVEYDSAKFGPEALHVMEQSSINPFWLALQFDRACERGTEIAEELVKILKKRNLIPQTIEGIEACANYIKDLFDPEDDGEFYYRHAPLSQFEIEEIMTERLAEQKLDLLEEDFDKPSKTKKHLKNKH
jgi:ferredoxin